MQFITFLIELIQNLFGSVGFGNLLKQVFAGLFCTALMLNTGCSAEYWTGRIKPVTRLQANRNGVAFDTSQEHNVKATGLKVDPETKKFEAEDISITSNSSNVIDADARRMQWVIEGQKTQIQYMETWWAGAVSAISAGGDVFEKYMRLNPFPSTRTSGFNVSTPWGDFGNQSTTGFATAEAEGMRKEIEDLRKQLAEATKAKTPESRPAQ